MVAAAFVMAAAGPVRAEIETIVAPGSKSLTPFSAPKLPRVPGWETELKASLARQARLLFPLDAPAGKPGAVMVAQAIPKTSTGGIQTLAEFIDDQQLNARAQDVGVEITEIPVVTDKAGRKIRVFAERGSTRLSFRATAYGEEKDASGTAYWTIFAVNADTQAGLAQAVGPFQDMLRNYR